MQGGVTPAGAEFLRQGFEFRYRSLRDGALLVLKVRITKIDPAAKGAMLACRAEVINLKRAPIPRDRLLERLSGFEKNFGLEGTYKECVSVLRESATASRCIATRLGGRHDCIHLGVNNPNLFTEGLVHDASIRSS